MRHSDIRHFLNDNKGSAILSVVLSMIFVVALGTALLYAAYVGLKVSSVSRSDKENFYNASTAMDEVLDGIRGEVSIALESAYTKSVAEYAKFPEYDPDELVLNLFVTELGEVKIGGELAGTFSVDKDLQNEVTISLDIDKLIENYEPEYATVNIDGAVSGEIDILEGNISDNSNWPIAIKNISMVYIDEKGFEADISTDILIERPDFKTLAVPKNTFAIIAKGGIELEKPLAMSGGIYVGSVGLSVEKDLPLTIKNGKVISEGAIEVGEDAKLTFTNDSTEVRDIWAPNIVLGKRGSLTIDGPYKIYAGEIELGEGASLIINNPGNEIWALEIVAGEGSTITINGNCYVADDLVLKSGSKVTLEGSYYGFGSDDAGTEDPDTSKSSSIYVDSYGPDNKASLDISGLDSLNLAGVSFINVFGDKVATGQSVAIKPDQLAYMIPAAAISNYKTNPAVLQKNEEGKPIAPMINTAVSLWGGKTLAYYIGDSDTSDNTYSGASGSIVTHYPQDKGTGYVFINFKSQAKANEYFRDYFNARPEAIKQYLDIYLDLMQASSGTTKGNTYQYGDDWENIIGSAWFNDPEAEYYSELYYKKMEKPPEQPYETYVNTEELAELGNDPKKPTGFIREGKNFNKDEDVVAILNNGNIEFNPNSYKNLDLIVANGDVEINEANFSGTIIANGVIRIKINVNTVFEFDDLVQGGLDTENRDGKTLSYYINPAGFGGDQAPGFSTENLWAPEKLVSYSNWQKN